jgi:hypothetical protein
VDRRAAVPQCVREVVRDHLLRASAIGEHEDLVALDPDLIAAHVAGDFGEQVGQVEFRSL